MGQARAKLAVVRQMFLANLDDWAFEPTAWEAQTVNEIEKLPVVKVRRYPDNVLKDMRMPARECHANAKYMEDNDPEKRTKHITGWWIQFDCFILHSVILRDGQYACVTPAPYESADVFDFVPDAAIVWRDNGRLRSAFRDDVMIGKGVRKYPSKKLEEVQMLKARLLSGMNPYEAMRR